MKQIIVSYEKVTTLLKLDERDKEIDTILVESASENIRFLCDRDFILQEYTETLMCEQGALRLKQWPIQSVTALKNKNEMIETPIQFTTSDTDNCVYIDTAYNDSTVTITYMAGYDEDTMPSSLVQAVLAIFQDRKNEMALRLQGNFPEQPIKSAFNDVMQLLDPYKRKRL